MEEVERFVTDSMMATGVPRANAAALAQVLAAADVRGHYSHGLHRLGEVGRSGQVTSLLHRLVREWQPHLPSLSIGCCTILLSALFLL